MILPPFQEGESERLLVKTMPFARSWLVKFNPASDIDVTSGIASP